jgi:hypothetical protein
MNNPMERSFPVDTAPVYNHPAAIEEAFLALKMPTVGLPPGERALMAVPRSSDAWRMPRDSYDNSSQDSLLLLPMHTPLPDALDYEGSDKRGIYMNVLPSPLILHPSVGPVLESWAERLAAVHPKEHTLAQDKFGVPMLFGRFDAALDEKGNLGIYELDDVCSLWGWNPEINPLAEIGFMDMEDELLKAGHALYLAELYENVMGGPEHSTLRWLMDSRLSKLQPLFTQRTYAHCDRLDRMALPGNSPLPGEVAYDPEAAILFRARRDAALFHRYAGILAAQGVTPMETRDDKTYLANAGLGVLACDLQTALDAGERIIANSEHTYVVLKTQGARTEGTAILTGRGSKEAGVYKRAQVERKLGGLAAQPVVLQPFYRPPTMAQVGLQFSGHDAAAIKSVQHRGPDAGRYTVPGQEDRFKVILRTFVVYSPAQKRFIHVGGQWAASPGLMVHGAANSVAGPAYDAGYLPAPHKLYKSARAARQLIEDHSTGLRSELPSFTE